MRKNIPRFRRDKEIELPLKLQDRDREILKHVSDYRLLTIKQLQHLLSCPYVNLTRRLQKMFQYGYLDRLESPTDRKIISALGNKGANVLAGRPVAGKKGEINWKKKNEEVHYQPHIEHTLMLADFRISLTLALRATGAELCNWLPESAEIRDKVTIRQDGRKITLPISPDAYFVLKHNGKYMNFLVEADRSTMDKDRFFKKMQGYWEFYKQGRHKDKLGINSFRVLTICISDERVEGLRAKAKEADDAKKGSVMFWFTHESNHDPANPEKILDSVWLTPRGEDTHCLLE